MRETVPVACVIPTRSRAAVISRTLESVRRQSSWPSSIVICDSSVDQFTKEVCGKFVDLPITYLRASAEGAASQRNEAVTRLAEDVRFIWFLDDDVLLEPECLERLWYAIQDDFRLGGVNAMITNQQFRLSGRGGRFFLRLIGGSGDLSDAGRVIGPAMNLLPEDRDDLPEVVPVEWLNTTCTLYRREALPRPPFRDRFKGYSLMEDLALSLEVRKRGWNLANVRTARIVHDSQPGEHKRSAATISRMELANRHYIMRYILDRRSLGDYARLALLECFQLISAVLNRRTWLSFPAVLAGKVAALSDILTADDHQ